MIFESATLSPSQKIAMEELVGRELQENETITLCVYTPRMAATSAPEPARRFRGAINFSGRRLTDAEYEEAILEAGCTPQSLA